MPRVPWQAPGSARSCALQCLASGLDSAPNLLGGAGTQGELGPGGSGRWRGVSGRGRSASSSSNEPAHASRLVRNELRLKSRLIVAGTEVSSNWDVVNGPRGSWKTLPRLTRGEMSIAPERSPSRRKSNAGPQAVVLRVPATYPSQIGRRHALFLLGHISPIFAPFFLVFSRFSPS